MVNTIYSEFGKLHIKRDLELPPPPPNLKEIGFEKFFSLTCPELGGELNFEQQEK